MGEKDSGDIHSYLDNAAKKLLRKYYKSVLKLIGIFLDDKTTYIEDTAQICVWT